ncbi:hypothetical protein PRZ48_012519 [Zasmidium cellare]|uniref:Uncharacterized protein n=1 Tax=Zasmidium cellare TaxID=395010 RepID=A0ABR0E541_ZASCE|nr:hypothetical protein PRZ48_012519 [Zasmidium cellare]
MAGPDLLWIDCNETQPAKRHEAAAAARQHVMLNYIAKQNPEYPTKAGHADGRDEDDDEGAVDSRTPPRKPSPKGRPSHALKGKGTRIKRGIPLSNATKIPLTTTIKPALLIPEDNEMYQAAWWHSLNLCQTDQRNGWIDICRQQWGQGFWEFAKEDGTLREIFLSYAAAKEASVKSLADSREYFVHKGRAMRLVAKDLQKEGKDLRIAAVATICLLAKATFIEEEYEAGEAHVRAVKAVVQGRLFELPSFLWLFVIWADLRLTGVSSRAPVLPYALHPDFDGARLPMDMIERARFLGSCNMLSLPEAKVLDEEKTALLFQRLHELALVYNKPTDTDWPAVWVVTYEAAWMLSNMRNEIHAFDETHEDLETPYNAEKILLLAASIQMWSTVSQFVPQPGFLRYALEQLTLALSHLTPQTLSSTWAASSANPTSLLWVLFNASAAAIKLTFTGHLSPSLLPHWLWLDLQHVCATLEITSASAFEQALRPFPFADNWNGRMAGTVWLWLKTGFVLEGEGRRRGRRVPFFADLRLTFDVEVDERGRRSGMERDTKKKVEGNKESSSGEVRAREVAGKAFEVALVGREGVVV